jgi:hypothetical protein
MSDFEEFPKIPRLKRDCTITEKIDGTNGQIYIHDDGVTMEVGSRSGWLGERDNYGFYAWAMAHKDELLRLGPGRHFGEWWGAGIQRRYGQTEKRFSLFNSSRWTKDTLPSCVGVVPILYIGPFSTDAVDMTLATLREDGSVAAPGFRNPEGVIVYLHSARQYFKVTLEKDEEPKGMKR